MINKISVAVSTILITLIASVLFLLSFYSIDSKEIVYSVTSSIYFIIPLILLNILILIFPFISKMTVKSYISYILTHYSLLLLSIAIIFSFITNREYTFTLTTGDELAFNTIRNQLGLINDSMVKLRLNRVEADEYRNNSRIKTVRSVIDVNIDGNNEQWVIEINKPIKVFSTKIYQLGYNTGIISAQIEINNQTYTIRDNLQLSINNKTILIEPSEISGTKIRYRWIVLSDDNSFSEGFITITDSVTEIDSGIRLRIVEETPGYLTTLKATYKPFNKILTITALIFILGLFIDLFIIKHFFRRKE